MAVLSAWVGAGADGEEGGFAGGEGGGRDVEGEGVGVREDGLVVGFGVGGGGHGGQWMRGWREGGETRGPWEGADVAAKVRLGGIMGRESAVRCEI